ncbi:predicted protein [Sclerotinia sclerotiorum 1980 UF-70]|uniref:Secreted protein n=1 Tax=Sclerotinia sclerotiorum (strain ATCC 18683 / 1980 / Ss-1) TaxID=665079 RepID=A7EBX2_SCLS1|nr:predicted protein [Sclerotinia sclerotiorum 1980 UF-70]EDN99950.1 predicted protein [Sclerotinia sclerotiorum 1980 UF-70]
MALRCLACLVICHRSCGLEPPPVPTTFLPECHHVSTIPLFHTPQMFMAVSSVCEQFLELPRGIMQYDLQYDNQN